jgi:hypothetical protein
MSSLEAFKTIWLVDFEFIPGAPLCDPVCLVAHEFKSGQTIRLWRDQFGLGLPYSVGPESLFVAYSAAAELGCHLALGWPLPERVLDLYFEWSVSPSMYHCLIGDKPIGAPFRIGSSRKWT